MTIGGGGGGGGDGGHNTKKRACLKLHGALLPSGVPEHMVSDPLDEFTPGELDMIAADICQNPIPLWVDHESDKSVGEIYHAHVSPDTRELMITAVVFDPDDIDDTDQHTKLHATLAALKICSGELKELSLGHTAFYYEDKESGKKVVTRKEMREGSLCLKGRRFQTRITSVQVDRRARMWAGNRPYENKGIEIPVSYIASRTFGRKYLAQLGKLQTSSNPFVEKQNNMASLPPPPSSSSSVPVPASAPAVPGSAPAVPVPASTPSDPLVQFSELNQQLNASLTDTQRALAAEEEKRKSIEAQLAEYQRKEQEAVQRQRTSAISALQNESGLFAQHLDASINTGSATEADKASVETTQDFVAKLCSAIAAGAESLPEGIQNVSMFASVLRGATNELSRVNAANKRLEAERSQLHLASAKAVSAQNQTQPPSKTSTTANLPGMAPTKMPEVTGRAEVNASAGGGIAFGRAAAVTGGSSAPAAQSASVSSLSMLPPPPVSAISSVNDISLAALQKNRLAQQQYMMQMQLQASNQAQTQNQTSAAPAQSQSQGLGLTDLLLRTPIETSNGVNVLGAQICASARPDMVSSSSFSAAREYAIPAPLSGSSSLAGPSSGTGAASSNHTASNGDGGEVRVSGHLPPADVLSNIYDLLRPAKRGRVDA